MAEGTSPAWWPTLEENSKSAGVNPEWLAKTAGQESGFRNIGSNTSSAFGPFQFIKPTWEGLSKRRPELSLTNRYDPEQQARAIPHFTRENLDIMEGALKRRVTGGEAYLAHFLGTGDAPRVVNASDDTPIQNVISPSAFAANQAVFGKFKTAGDVRRWADRVSGGVSPYGDSYVPRQTGVAVPTDVSVVPNGARIQTADMQPPNPITRNELRDAAQAASKDAYGFGEGAWNAVINESALTWAFHGDRTNVPDPNFRWTPEFHKEITKDIPQEHWSYFDRAQSEGQARWLRQQMLKDLEYEKKMNAMGATGIGLKMFGAIVDIVGWTAAAATGPLVAGAKFGRLGMILARGAEGAFGGVVQALPGAMNKPTGHALDLVYAGAGGMVLGSAFGALARNPAAADLAEQGARIGKSIMADVEEQALGSTALTKNVGAAEASPRMAVRADTYDFIGPHIEDVAPKAVFGSLRYDFAGLLGKSEAAITRLLGANLVEDAVGRAKGLETPFSASEMQRKMQIGFETRFMQSAQSTFKEWADDLGLNWAERQSREIEFRTQVTEAIRNVDPNVTFHPAVDKMAAATRKLYADYLDLAQNPGVLDGTSRRAVRGMEDVQKNPNYVPRIISGEKFTDWSTRFGDKQIAKFITAAVKGMRPDLDEEVAKKIGKGWYKRLRDVHAGQEMTAGRALFGEDLEYLRQALKESTDLSDDEVGKIVHWLQPKDSEGGIARAKQRTLMDENFRGVMKDNTTGEMVEVRLADLFDNDALRVFQTYNRQMSGQIALARLRIKNPAFKDNPDAPEWLVDGVTSRGEWDTLMKQVSSVWDEIKPGDKRAAKDVQRLNFIYDAIAGVPSKFAQDHKGWAQFLRVVRDYNYIRVMNQVGFAQVADAGQLVSQAGFRASLEGMPALKSLWRNAKTGKLNDELAQELEYITSGGTDWLRGAMNARFDDFDNHMVTSPTGSVLDKAEAILDKGKRVTSALSFMAPVNTHLQRWAAKAALARFVNDASGASSKNVARLKAMGLDDDMIARVGAELKDKVTYIDSDMRVGKIKTLNLDAWEPEVRNAFENSLWRMTRRMVQENDLGQSNMFFSSELGKVLFQFRAFMLASWTKQFLYGINMRDWTSFVGFSMSSALGSLVYMGQTHLQAIGRSDRDKFLEERLSPAKIGAAAFQRAGWSSFMPMVGDFGAQALGYDPLFNTRASGLSATTLGNPTFDLFDKAHKAVGGVAETVTRGNAFSQPDARNVIGLLPFQNFLPWMNVYNTFIRPLPEKEPRNSKR